MFSDGNRYCYSGGLSVGVVGLAVLDDGAASNNKFQGEVAIPQDMWHGHALAAI